MAKQYFAIGVDHERDAVANSVGQLSAEEAVRFVQNEFEGVTVHHVIEIDVVEKPATKIPVTKLKV